MNEKMNISTTATSSYELASLAVALYLRDHQPGSQPDDLGVTDYYQEAWDRLVAAREFLKARERQEPPTS